MKALVLVAVVACSNKSAPPPVAKDKATPVVVADAAPITQSITQLAMGNDHACALTSDGKVQCFGDPGTLGAAPLAACKNNYCPAQLAIDGVTAIAAGFAATCAVKSGKVLCWGYTDGGLAGRDSKDRCEQVLGAVKGKPVKATRPCEKTPFEVPSVTDAIAVAFGINHACAVTKAGSVWCWGNPSVVGGAAATCADFDGKPAPCSPPTKLAFANAVEVVATEYATCARAASGKVQCIGSDLEGELGDQAKQGHISKDPVDVVGLDDAVQLAAARNTFCARKKDGHVVCWGSNTNNALGNGLGEHGANDDIKGSSHVVNVLAGSKVMEGATDLWSTQGVTCAARVDGVWCWGEVYAAPGLTDLESEPCAQPKGPVCDAGTAIHVANTNVARVYELGAQICALATDSTVRCRWPGQPALADRVKL